MKNPLLQAFDTAPFSKIKNEHFLPAIKELIEVTKAEIDTRRASILEQIGGAESLPTALVNAGIAPEDLDKYIEALSFSDKITQTLVAKGVTEDQIGTEIQKLIVAKADELGVTVNPRYGKWDPTVADIVDSDPASSAVTPSGN